MPPPQTLLASRVHGFVCKSCLAKLRAPRSQRPPWLLRSVATENGPPRGKLSKKRKDSHDQHENDSVIKVFDQFPDGVRKEVGNEPGDKAILESLQSTIRDVTAEMEAEREEGEIDDEELQDRVIGRHMQNILPGKGFQDFMSSQMESQMEELDAKMDKRLENVDLEKMTEEERQIIREELLELAKDEPHNKPDRQPLSTFESTASPLNIPLTGFPRTTALNIRALNRVLRSAAKKLEQGEMDGQIALATWTAYARCRAAFKEDPYRVPNEVWQLLWNVFADARSLNNAYMMKLGQDMTEIGLPLQDWQRLFYIQATFIKGDRTAAVQQWQEYETTVGRNSDAFKGYWELGISMYCQTGYLDKALKVAETLIQYSGDATTFRAFIPIIEGFLSSKEKGSKQKAWALYIRLRLGLGAEMTMKDYDALASMFFSAELPDLALGIFKDMMLAGDTSAKQHDSMVLFGNGPGVKSDLDLMKIGENELTWDDPRVLAKLPAKFNNKFFFGKWLKKLIGDGEFESSLKVFNLMHERGIRPDARYVNGLIGAWLRTGKALYHTLAEDTAWKMIRERLEYVENENRRTAAVSAPLRMVGWDDKPDYKPIFRHPAATIETFAILIQDYRRRQRHDRMRDVLAAVQKAKMKPSTFFMNQMMMVETEVRQFWAWDMYISFTRTQGVNPDFDTYVFLWYLAKKALDVNSVVKSKEGGNRKVARNITNTDVPRYLFAEMVKWAPVLNKKGKLSKELYDMIILSFSLAQDQPGTAIALRALQRHFDMLPSEDTVRTIVVQLARSGFKNETGHFPRRFNAKRSAAVKERIKQVTKLLEGFQKQRVDALLQQGIVFDELKEEAKREESLKLMVDLLRHVTELRLEEGQSVKRAFLTAGKHMAVPECVP